MLLRLTNCGHRYISERLLATQSEDFRSDARMLHRIYQSLLLKETDSTLQEKLLERGLIELVPEHTSYEETALRYERNPLENIRVINFEMTTKCNLSCLHCRSGIVKRTTETDIDALKSAAELFLELGITGFIFIGGEVSKYADGWLELVRHITDYYEENSHRLPSRHWGGLNIGLLTSGWWLEKKDFRAAGEEYTTDREYMTALEEAGLTHLLFSIDGSEELHDRWRRVPGLYQRIMRGIPRVKDVGLLPRVSIVLESNEHTDYDYIADIAELVYDFPEGFSKDKKIGVLLNDPVNYASNFIDINNGVQLSQGRMHIDDVSSRSLRCKAFFRPSPKLTISANGEVSICPLMNAAEKYGNIHQRSLTDVLNQFHENFLFQVHAERKIESYLPMMDREIFGEHFDHYCSLRTVLNLIARRMHEQGLSPENIKEEDRPLLMQINHEVARWTGHQKARKKKQVVS